MTVLQGSGTFAAATGCAALSSSGNADGDNRDGEDWYYVGGADNYARRIETASPTGERNNHIVLWGCRGDDLGARTALSPVPGCELGGSCGTVAITYGPGADPATATITIGTASVEFDPRTVADVTVWRADAEIDGQRSALLFTWDAAARRGAGAFVFAGFTG